MNSRGTNEPMSNSAVEFLESALEKQNLAQSNCKTIIPG